MYLNVQAEMIRQGISIDVMSDHLGITRRTFSLKLKGRYPFTLKEALTIKAVLNVDIPLEELFEEAI